MMSMWKEVDAYLKEMDAYLNENFSKKHEPQSNVDGSGSGLLIVSNYEQAIEWSMFISLVLRLFYWQDFDSVL